MVSFKREEENLDHLLLHCAKVRDLWDLLFFIFGINWVLHSSVQEIMAGWRRPFAKKKAKKIWLAAPILLFWCIWRERNKAVFDGGGPSTQKLKNAFVHTLWSWTLIIRVLMSLCS